MKVAQNESNDNANGETPNEQQGFFIRGAFLGVQEARTFKRNGTGETVNVKPRLGLRVNGVDFELVAKDDAQMQEARRGLVKGDVVTFSVDPRPPYGSPRGSEVDLFLPGAYESRRAEWK